MSNIVRVETDNGFFLIGPLVAIQYDGKLVEANKSYEYNDKCGIGNINNESILSMFAKLKKERGVKSCKDIKSVYEYMNKYVHVYSGTTKSIQDMMKYYRRKKQVVDYGYFQEDIPSFLELEEPEMDFC